MSRSFYTPPRPQIERAKRLHRKAFQAWEPDDDLALKLGAENGTDLLDLAAALDRSPRAIRMRLELLGLLDRWQRANSAAETPAVPDPENEIAKDALAYSKKELQAPQTDGSQGGS